MRAHPLMQFRTAGILWCALAILSSGPFAASGQSTASSQLLGKAHSLELRGRMDMAKQVWQQVLLSDPNNTEALAGLARAAKSEGHIDEANSYLAKLRAINPSDPNISKVENMGTQQDPNILLKQAGQLAQQGQYGRAMAILKQVYGNNPPEGEAALSYYQTEAATEDTRPQAIAGLRALMDKYPNDPSYAIALGKILTYNPRTRAEGRKLLSHYPNNPEASEALRQSLLWDAQNPGTAGDIKAYVNKHPDQQLSNILTDDEKLRASQIRRTGPAITPEQKAAMADRAEQGREVQQAYAALNAKRFSEAEQRFNVMLEKNANDPKALAGLGYIRMQQANFAGAISYLSQAQQSGDNSPGIAKALSDARFYYTMREATGALNEDDLNTAITDFQNAYAMRPTDATALQGLGGTLLKAEQPEPAIAVYQQYTKLHPSDSMGWKGLFLSYAAANQFDMALQVNGRIPYGIKSQLQRDPDYLRTLASIYSATNHDVEAQRTLQMALQLPFPADARGLRADVQMQYASLLEAAGHHSQAAGLYREVLAADSTNTNAWVGLIQTEHTLGNDADAFQQLTQMPPASFQAAMQEPGFATTVASIYIGQNRDDLAQSTLEQFLSYQATNNQKPFVAAQVTLANLYLKHNDTAHAFPLFESVLTNNPDRPDAWKGLLSSLHATGHDQEALAEIQQVPVDMRRQLEADPDYLQLVGNIYASLGHPQDAMRFLNRAQAHYRLEGLVAPSNVDIQTAWLLFNAGNDPQLYTALMKLGARPDLTDEQRRTVQVIWASWAVRRSQQALLAGNPKRAIAILNAAARAFPGNPGVLNALGSGYAAAGLYKEAIQIFRAQDLSTGSVSDYHAAVGAALAANDLKDAEVWLRFGLAQYPKDAQLLSLAAKFETARGNSGRAADYYRASLSADPGPDPGTELAEALSHGATPPRLPTANAPQDLATLLSQPDGVPREGTYQVEPRPYLPSYANQGAQAPVVLNRTTTTTTATTTYSSNYGAIPKTSSGRHGTTTSSTLGSYEPDVPVTTYVAPASASSGYSYPSTTQSARVNTISSPDTFGYSLPSQSTGTAQAPVTGTMSGTPGYGYANPPSGPEPIDSGPMTYPAVTGPEPGYTAPVPVYAPQTYSPGGSTAGTGLGGTIGNYVPQSSLRGAPLASGGGIEAAALHLTVAPAREAFYRSFGPGQAGTVDPWEATGVGRDAAEAAVQQDNRKLLSVKDSFGDGESVFLREAVASTPAELRTVVFQPQQSSGAPTADPFAVLNDPQDKRKTKKKPAKQVTPQPSDPFANLGESAAGQHSTIPHAQQHAETTATPKYIPPPIFIPPSEQPSNRSSIPASRTIHFPTEQTAKDRAAAIHANQTNAPQVLEGTSHPPVENYDTETNGTSNGAAKLSPTQFSTSPYNPAQAQGAQIQQPTAPADTTGSGQTGTPGQQYPQPRTGATTSTTHRRAPITRVDAAPVVPVVPAQQAPMSYPVYPQPLSNEGTPQPPGTYPLPTAPSDTALQERGAPPLRGYYDPRVSEDPRTPLTEREQTELDLALIEASYSDWIGGSAIGSYRSGRPGVDRLAGLEVPFEASIMLGKTARINVIPKAVFLSSGQLVLDSTAVVQPILGTLYSSATTAPSPAFASGVGGELQFVTSTFGAALGYSPYGFPVSNMIGRVRWRPGNWHFTFFGGRDSIKETMLSYAGLRDPGSPFGTIWGGVVQTGGGARFDVGDEKSGFYVQAEGADLSGYHVLENHKIDGTMGAYFRVYSWPEYGTLNIGGTLFGEHYDYNERGQTYGLGGYFSPNVYFLAALPVSFSGHWKENLHYVINGSIGLQTFQEDSQIYFPLDGAAQAGVPVSACTPICGLQVNSSTGANYSVDAQLSYHINQHWYIGGFLSANNTNNYNTITGGAFARYLFKPQIQTVVYPTGLFPVEGFRPLRVP